MRLDVSSRESATSDLVFAIIGRLLAIGEMFGDSSR